MLTTSKRDILNNFNIGTSISAPQGTNVIAIVIPVLAVIFVILIFVGIIFYRRYQKNMTGTNRKLQ